MHYTYIIYSETKDRYYTGSTSVGVEKRVERHNSGWSRSTKSGIPWKVEYTKSFEVKTDALKWERYIKRQKSRSFIESLIESVENENKRE